MSDDLSRLARMHGTDKCAIHRYTQHYHRHFKELRDMPIHLLEIGIGGYDAPDQGGDSLRMWRDYFPNGQIYGLDYFEKPGVAGDRIKVYQGSQASALTLASILSDAPAQQFDIVIDDGSHRSEHVIATFWMLFQHVAPNGWYVVEDIQTSYWPSYGGASNPQPGRPTTMEFFKSLVDGLNWEEVPNPGYSANYTDHSILGIHFYHNMIFVQKGLNTEGSNLLRANRFPDQ